MRGLTGVVGLVGPRFLSCRVSREAEGTGAATAPLPRLPPPQRQLFQVASKPPPVKSPSLKNQPSAISLSLMPMPPSLALRLFLITPSFNLPD